MISFLPCRDSAERALVTLVALLMLAFPSHAGAVLGSDDTSVPTDQVHLKSTLSVTQTGQGAIHELRLGSGTIVREYAAPNGTVFAVAWEGPWLPDLRHLLGAYFDQYANATRMKPRTRGPLVIREPELIVEISGHMRAFVGRAYLPQMIPAGLRTETIR